MEVDSNTTPKNLNNFTELNSLNSLNGLNRFSTPENYAKNCSSTLSSEAISGTNGGGFSSLINPIVENMNRRFLNS